MTDSVASTQTLTAALKAANDVRYTLKPSGSKLTLVANKSLAVSVAVLDDAQRNPKPIQLILPATHLVELDTLNRLLGGDHRALTPLELEQHALPHHGRLPAMPHWCGLHCIVHTSLLNQDLVTIEADTSDEIVELDQKSFHTLTEACQILDIAGVAPNTPMDPKEDEQAILKSVQNFTERRIRQRLEETLEFPPLPRTAMRVIKLRAQQETDIRELTDIIEGDPALAAQVVSWASSPYYRAPGQIKSVHDAIVRVLGFDTVLNLALGLSLSNGLKFKQVSLKEVDQYWRKTMLLAGTCEALSLGIPAEQRPERSIVYLSGLIANLGYLLLAEIFPLYFQQIKRQHAANPHLSSTVIEQQVLNLNNNQIAAWLLENWQMPKQFVDVIRFSSEPSYAGNGANICHIILCARQLLARHELLEPCGHDMSDGLLETLEIDPAFAEAQIEKIKTATENYQQSIN